MLIHSGGDSQEQGGATNQEVGERKWQGRGASVEPL